MELVFREQYTFRLIYSNLGDDFGVRDSGEPGGKVVRRKLRVVFQTCAWSILERKREKKMV